jgi:cupin 2 domain-containing protein
MDVQNFFKNEKLPLGEEEIFQTIFEASDLQIEKIISKGQVTPRGKWYDSNRSEWVVLLQGKASLVMENGRTIHLSSGDYLTIPAGLKHRVTYTSSQPVCLWLAVHFQK